MYRCRLFNVDCSWVVRSFANGDLDCRIKKLINIALCFSTQGFNVNLVCDGYRRHHSKRATLRRKAENQKKRIQLVLLKSELMLMLDQRQNTDSIVECSNILEKEKNIQSKIRSYEKHLQQVSIEVGNDFIMNFKDAVNALTNTNNIIVTTALFQADSVMSYNVINNNTDIILTADSDQATILGNKCICIKYFKYVEGKDKSNIEQIELFFAEKKTMEYIASMIHVPEVSERKKLAKYPVFEGIDCCRVRALIAVGLGCDVNLLSIVTPTPLLLFLQSPHFNSLTCNDEKYNTLLSFLINSWDSNVGNCNL